MKLKNNFIKNLGNPLFKLGLFLLSLFSFFIFSTRISYASILDLVEYTANPLKFILYLLTNLLYIISTYVLGTMVTIASAIFEWSLNLVTSSNTHIVATGWGVSLSFANMFFILILLAVAIATILGTIFENFNYKKALPNLIIVMLLINFSMVIGNIPVDISNVLAKYFNSEITAKGGGLSGQLMKSIRITETNILNLSLLDKQKSIELIKSQEAKKNGKTTKLPLQTEEQKEIDKNWKAPPDPRKMPGWKDLNSDQQDAEFAAYNEALEKNPSTLAKVTKMSIETEIEMAKSQDFSKEPDIVTQFLTILSTFIFIIIYQLIAIFMLLVGAVYMIQRTFWIWLLLMIAPLAWLAYAIPGLNQYFTMWWKKLLAWCFFAPVFLFFTFLSIVVSYSSFGSLNTNVSIANKDLSSLLSANAGNFIQLLAVAFLMTFGIVAGQKMGVGGSNFVMNYANKAKGAASKKFSDLRSKGPLSAEKLGAKLGGMGAGLLAKSRIGAVAGFGRETRERLQEERLQEQQKKENLQESRQKLKEFRDAKGERKQKLKASKEEKAELEKSLMGLQSRDPASLTPAEQSAMAFLPGELERVNLEIKKQTTDARKEELGILKSIRTATGGGKDLKKEFEKFAKAIGVETTPTPAP